VAARGAGAGGRRRRGTEPGEAGGAGGLAAAPPAGLPLRAGLVLGPHPGCARRLPHRRGAGPRPRRAPQPPLQVRGPGRAPPLPRAGDGRWDRGGLNGHGRPGWGPGREGRGAEGSSPVHQQAPARVPLVAGSFDCVEWSLLPPATEEMVAQAERLRGRFQGDPAAEYACAQINAEDAERWFGEGKEVNAAEHVRGLSAAAAPLTESPNVRGWKGRLWVI